MTMSIRIYILIIALPCLLLQQTASAGPGKSYVVKAEQVIGYVMAKGHKFESKALNDDARCEIVANRLRTHNTNLVFGSMKRGECQFILFKPGNLKNGWKIRNMIITDNHQGNWNYMNKPHGKKSLLTIIHAKGKYSDGANPVKPVLELTIKTIEFVGPASSSNWKQAIKRN